MFNKKNMLKTGIPVTGAFLASTFFLLFSVYGPPSEYRKKFIDEAKINSMSSLMNNLFPLSIWLAYIVTGSCLAPMVGYKVSGLVVDEIQGRGFFGIKNNKDDNKLEEILVYDSSPSSESAFNEENIVSMKPLNA